MLCAAPKFYVFSRNLFVSVVVLLAVTIEAMEKSVSRKIVEAIVPKKAMKVIDSAELAIKYMGDGKNPLHNLAEKGELQKIADIIGKQTREDLNQKDDGGNTPMHFAAYAGKLEIVALLKMHGATLNLENKRHQIPLHLVVLKGDLDTIEFIVNSSSKGDLDRRDTWGRTPLHYAAQNGDVKIIKLLTTDSSRTPTQNGRNTEVASFDVKDEEGWIPPFCAISHEKVGAVRFFVQHYDKWRSFKGALGQTALHSAASSGNAEIGKLLSDVCSDSPDLEGQGALFYAISSGSIQFIEFLLVPESPISTLNVIDKSNRCPLHFAIEENQVGVVKLLTRYGACDDERITMQALEKALSDISDKRLQILGIICKKIAKQKRSWISNYRVDGGSLLHFAVRKNFWEAINPLIKAGVGLELKDKDERTPLIVAVDRNEGIGCIDAILSNAVATKKTFLDRDKSGLDVFYYAVRNGNIGQLTRLKEFGNRNKILLPKTYDTKLKNNRSNLTLLHCAAENFNNGMIEYLIKEFNIDINATCALGRSAILDGVISGVINLERLRGNKESQHDAKLNNCYSTLETLIRKGAKVDLGDGQKETPLHVAVKGRWRDVVKLLIQNSADINAQNSQGKTPLHYILEIFKHDITSAEVFLALIKCENIRYQLPDNTGCTPLHLLAKIRFDDVAIDGWRKLFVDNFKKDYEEKWLPLIITAQEKDKENKMPGEYLPPVPEGGSRCVIQ